MNKKLSLTLCMTIICYSTSTLTNSSYANSSHENPSHAKQTYTQNQYQNDEISLRLAAIDREEENQYFKTNCCWIATGLSGLLTVFTIIAKGDANIAFGGGAGALIFGGLGLVSMTSEADKANKRKIERLELLKLRQNAQK
jgi:hypothetical protein